jgi:hypothetical protein
METKCSIDHFTDIFGASRGNGLTYLLPEEFCDLLGKGELSYSLTMLCRRPEATSLLSASLAMNLLSRKTAVTYFDGNGLSLTEMQTLPA